MPLFNNQVLECVLKCGVYYDALWCVLRRAEVCIEMSHLVTSLLCGVIFGVY